jgi:hypothetical protein
MAYNPQIEWVWEALSSVHAGLDSLALIHFIKDIEQQPSENRNLLRSQLHDYI